MNWSQKVATILESGMTKAALARECGMTPPWVSYVLDGRVKEVSWGAGQTLIKIERRVTRQAKNR